MSRLRNGRGARRSTSWALAFFAGALSLLGCARDQAPDLVVFDGDIYTVDPSRPKAQAFAVTAGRITAIGNGDEIMALADRDTLVRDAEGHTVIPGLIDGHAHLGAGLDLIRGVDLYGLDDKEAWLSRIEHRAKGLEPGEWLLGGRWDHTLLASGELPTRWDLDRVAPRVPVALSDVDGHALWVNSRALELAGVDASTPDPVGGRILHRAETGEPTGILLEAGALITGKIPPMSREQRLLRRRDTLDIATRLGITAVHEIGSRRTLDDYRELQRQEDLPVRIWFGITSGGDGDDSIAEGSVADDPGSLSRLRAEIEDENRRWMLARGERGPLLALGFVKRFVDGVLSSRTAALLAPYSDAPLELGLPRWTAKELAAEVTEINRAGLPVALHAIGDLGVRLSLDAFQAARNEVRPISPPNRIEHNEVVDPADASRYAEIGVIASMNPHHCISGIDKYNLERLGEKRAPWSFAWGRLRDAGASLLFGSDWPTAPLDPFQQLDAAVARQKPLPPSAAASDSGSAWYPENRLTFEQALAAYTLAGAQAAGWGDELGSLQVGKWADFVILDRRIATPIGRSLLDLRVEETFVAGRSVAGRLTLEE